MMSELRWYTKERLVFYIVTFDDGDNGEGEYENFVFMNDCGAGANADPNMIDASRVLQKNRVETLSPK